MICCRPTLILSTALNIPIAPRGAVHLGTVFFLEHFVVHEDFFLGIPISGHGARQTAVFSLQPAFDVFPTMPGIIRALPMHTALQ